MGIVVPAEAEQNQRRNGNADHVHENGTWEANNKSEEEMLRSDCFTCNVYLYMYIKLYTYTYTSIHAFVSAFVSALPADAAGCVGECDANKSLQPVPSRNWMLAVAKGRLGDL